MSREEKLAALLRLPWSVNIHRSDEGYFVARCAEIPGSIATGSDAEIEAEFWDSMRASLASLIDDGDEIPLPKGVKALPWEQRQNRMSLCELVPENAVITDAPGAFEESAVAAA